MDVFDYGAVIIFISAELESIGDLLSANEMFFLAFGWTKEETAGKDVEQFMPKHIAYGHKRYISKFAENKTKFTVWIKKTYAMTKQKFVLNVMTFVKLTTTFDTGTSTFSYVAYAKAQGVGDMIMLIDMYGKLFGFSK